MYGVMLWSLQTNSCQVFTPPPSVPCRRVLSELQQSCVFEGPPGRLFLTYDLTALEEKKYYKAGVLIGWSLAHGGPGPQCIHPTFYQVCV